MILIVKHQNQFIRNYQIKSILYMIEIFLDLIIMFQFMLKNYIKIIKTNYLKSQLLNSPLYQIHKNKKTHMIMKI